MAFLQYIRRVPFAAIDWLPAIGFRTLIEDAAVIGDCCRGIGHSGIGNLQQHRIEARVPRRKVAEAPCQGGTDGRAWNPSYVIRAVVKYAGAGPVEFCRPDLQPVLP